MRVSSRRGEGTERDAIENKGDRKEGTMVLGWGCVNCASVGERKLNRAEESGGG